MDLSALILHQIVLEVRYPQTYRPFDHAGELAETILDQLPEWTLAKANPASLEFAQLLSSLSATIGMQSAQLTQVQSQDCYDLENGKAFYQALPFILAPALTIYRVSTFTRIGFRVISHIPFQSLEALMKTWDSIPLCKWSLPEGAPKQSIPGTVRLKFILEDNIDLTLAVEGADYNVLLGQTQISVRTQKIHRLAPDKRKDAMKLVLEAEKRFRFLPKYGLQLDLDWSMEDVNDAKPDECMKFIASCQKKESAILRTLFPETK